MTAALAHTFDLSIVVPCHNEAQNLAALIERLTKIVTALEIKTEIILVDDGSTDETRALLTTHAPSTNPTLVCLFLARRYGQQIALSAGLANSRGARVFILDADMQDPPENLAAMMALMDQGADVVYGQRRSRTGDTAFKRFSASLYYRFLSAAGETPLPANVGDFRLINRRILDALNSMPERHRYLRGMIAWIGYKQVPYLYDRAPRQNGTSHYSLYRMIQLAMDGLTSFSTAPLRLSLWLGLSCGALAFVLLFYVLFSWFTNNTIEGWTSLACIFLFFSGLQFLCIGLIGDYVGRLYSESKQRPLYFIDTILGRENE